MSLAPLMYSLCFSSDIVSLACLAPRNFPQMLFNCGQLNFTVIIDLVEGSSSLTDIDSQLML